MNHHRNHPIAFIFPGQGSQELGMLSNFSEKYPLIREIFSQASEVLDINLWQIVQEGPIETLNEYSQPIMLTADIAIWKLWCDQGGTRPKALAGHSLGEYAALVASEALTLTDAVKLVSVRAQLMQDAVSTVYTGVAVILTLENEQVITICKEASQDQALYPINFNLPGQVVIGGEKEAVERAVDLAKKSGAKVRELPMSIPSHCPMMEPATLKLKYILDQIPINQPKIPVVNNVDIAVVYEPESIKDALIRQLTHPIRWVEVIHKLRTMGIETIVECGPKNILTNMNKRIDPELNRYALNNPETLDELL